MKIFCEKLKERSFALLRMTVNRFACLFGYITFSVENKKDELKFISLKNFK